MARPTGTVAVVELVVHEDWVGHRITDLEDATGARVAFMIRFGSGLLPEPKTVIQAGDQVYVAAIAGRAAEAKRSPPSHQVRTSNESRDLRSRRGRPFDRPGTHRKRS
ncbi:trkA-C domain protein [Mycobacterium xenopi 4042]|uniref:TrkA-C domain protein n=1 Tax=Mycobacterium xenopi 4042 TaxID=1299334 RepID=X8CGX4_MYCXE|nr:trkA-C domain protein [Mycobacterium xenopi 4042]